MTTEILKSASITNLDAVPAVRNTSGESGQGMLRQINDFVTTTTGKTTGSIYRIARVRSNVVVKQILLDSGAMSTSAAMDVGVYYSDDPLDPNYAANAGAVITQAFFASAVDVSSAIRATDITNESGTYTADKRNKELWDALGLSSDPGGYLDIAGTNTATITAGALFALDVRFVRAGD